MEAKNDLVAESSSKVSPQWEYMELPLELRKSIAPIPMKDVKIHQDVTGCHEHEKMKGRKPLVEEVSEWLSKILLAYKEEDMPVGILIAVYNEKEQGLYYMNDKGEVVKSNLVVTGAGSAGYSDVETLLVRTVGSIRSVDEASFKAGMAYCCAAFHAPRPGDNFSIYHLGIGGCNKVYEADYEREWAFLM